VAGLYGRVDLVLLACVGSQHQGAQQGGDGHTIRLRMVGGLATSQAVIAALVGQLLQHMWLESMTASQCVVNGRLPTWLR
jgi:hypothetical protein